MQVTEELVNELGNYRKSTGVMHLGGVTHSEFREMDWEGLI